MGPNGVGKSTLLLLLTGKLTPVSPKGPSMVWPRGQCVLGDCKLEGTCRDEWQAFLVHRQPQKPWVFLLLLCVLTPQCGLVLLLFVALGIEP